jgi:hypothetical protein
MLTAHYHLESSSDLMTFEFESIGPRGRVTKVIKYREINVKGYFNLGFGDKDPESGYVTDLSITNNNDSKRVLATVARTLYLFTDQYPDAVVIATGSTEVRTRLYRMGITNNIKAVEQDFEVLGLTDTGWEPFRKNITYHAFSVRRKV